MLGVILILAVWSSILVGEKNKKMRDAASVAPKTPHEYSTCGTCDECQSLYIATKMKAVQEEIRIKEKREFEARV
jgi:hypothetical protein